MPWMISSTILQADDPLLDKINFLLQSHFRPIFDEASWIIRLGAIVDVEHLSSERRRSNPTNGQIDSKTTER